MNSNELIRIHNVVVNLAQVHAIIIEDGVVIFDDGSDHTLCCADERGGVRHNSTTIPLKSSELAELVDKLRNSPMITVLLEKERS